MDRIKLLSFFLLIFGLCSCIPGIRKDSVYMDLNGRWEFRQAGDSTWYEATVPGTVHTDLYKNVLIGDPFYRSNEKEQQWIDKEDWEYRKIFTPDPALFSRKHIEINFEGIDTYADIFINDRLLLKTDNMFRSWNTDISSLLKKGVPNEVRIYFHSPIKHLDKIYAVQDYHLPAANDQAEKKLSVYARKAPYQFGWDWGPRFVTSGIWKAVSIESWDGIHLDDVFYRQIAIDSSRAEIEVIATVLSDQKCDATISVVNAKNGKVVIGNAIKLKKGIQTVREKMVIPKPELWWPNGLGDPHLYTLSTKIETAGHTSELVKRIGLRNAELVRQPDSLGESFYFRINGIPVFAKGANYIPQDNFLNHVMSTEYEHIIKSARDANMNMLRVWGGGIYELDYFYDLCDKYGIMVWQDFMFACSMYPGDQDFLDNFTLEARENVRRLRNHPSIVLWCGNNEVQDTWFNWGWKIRYSEEQKEAISENYQKIFHSIIPEVLAELDPDRPYWPSSPASGTSYGQTSNTHSGDFHYWGVWHSRLPFESYAEVIPRFSSEYGFQSFPSMKTIESYTLPADRQIDSEVMKDHQRHPIGNQLILDYMNRYYPVPEDFTGFVYMSQVMQGEGVRFGIEALRRSMPQCMGSLYWQLNDCWPVASWSGIDYFGRWKSLHYQAREAYAPELVSFSESADSVKVFLISDLTERRDGFLQLELIDFSGKKLFNKKIETAFLPLEARPALRIAKKDINGLQGNLINVFLKATFSDDNGELKNLHYFSQSKQMHLPDVFFDYEIVTKPERDYLRISSDGLARQVFIDYSGEDEVRFDPNFFDLLPGEEKTLKLYKLSRVKIDPEKITVQCINDYQLSE